MHSTKNFPYLMFSVVSEKMCSVILTYPKTEYIPVTQTVTLELCK